MLKEVKSQADKRRDVVAEDQFGRPWIYSMDLENGGPTGLIKPAGWTDPLRTPTKYLSVPRNKWGHADLGKMVLDVARWEKDQSEALRGWTRSFWEIGKNEYQSRFDPNDPATMKDPYLLNLVGNKPWPSHICLNAMSKPRHIAHSALLGNSEMNPSARELLGVDPAAYDAAEAAAMMISDDVEANLQYQDMSVKDFLDMDPTYGDYIAWAMKFKKLDMNEAARARREHLELGEYSKDEVKEPETVEV